MLSLSPAKILVILMVALVVLGPEKLPSMARQLGAAWGSIRRLRTRLEDEVRTSFPDLPPTHEVARAVRSPLSFLDRLADEHERSVSTTPTVDQTGATEAKSADIDIGVNSGETLEDASSNGANGSNAGEEPSSKARNSRSQASTGARFDASPLAGPGELSDVTPLSGDEPSLVPGDPSMN